MLIRPQRASLVMARLALGRRRTGPGPSAALTVRSHALQDRAPPARASGRAHYAASSNRIADGDMTPPNSLLLPTSAALPSSASVPRRPATHCLRHTPASDYASTTAGMFFALAGERESVMQLGPTS